jgi:hypothetical protein
MEKYIDMTVSGVTKADLKNILLDAGLSKMFLKREFFDGKVSVSVKEMRPYKKIYRDYNLSISADNIDRAAEVYNSIISNIDNKKYDNIKSNLYTDKEKYLEEKLNSAGVSRKRDFHRRMKGC